MSAPERIVLVVIGVWLLCFGLWPLLPWGLHDEPFSTIEVIDFAAHAAGYVLLRSNLHVQISLKETHS